MPLYKIENGLNLNLNQYQTQKNRQNLIILPKHNNLIYFNFYIDGCSLESNIGFFTSELGIGYDANMAYNDAFKKVYDRLYDNQKIILSKMKIIDYRILDINDVSKHKNIGFAFYPLDDLNN
jgi:hypothetical protein